MPYRVVLAVVVVVLSIQLVPVERTNPSPTGALTDVPAPVGDGLRRACYDCHSRETRWPWYSNVAPVSWLMQGHIDEGREVLNFSEWQRTYKEARESAETIDEGEMVGIVGQSGAGVVPVACPGWWRRRSSRNC